MLSLLTFFIVYYSIHVLCTVTGAYSSVYQILLKCAVPLALVGEDGTFLDGVVAKKDLVWRRSGVRACLLRGGDEGGGGEAWGGASRHLYKLAM